MDEPYAGVTSFVVDERSSWLTTGQQIIYLYYLCALRRVSAMTSEESVARSSLPGSAPLAQGFLCFVDVLPALSPAKRQSSSAPALPDKAAPAAAPACAPIGDQLALIAS
jgi:hypothetical protein